MNVSRLRHRFSNRDLTQSGRGDRTTSPIMSFDHHVLLEGVALFDPYASDEDANWNM